MGAVDDALTAFTAKLRSNPPAIAPVVGRSEAKNLGFGKSADPSEDFDMTDLGLLAAKIGVGAPDASAEATDLDQAISDAVIRSVDGTGTKGASGLSIYFPPTSDLFDPDYTKVTDHGGWSGFLNSYYHAGEAIDPASLPKFTNPNEEADSTLDENGLTISGTFNPAAEANLSDATISYGQFEADDSVTYFGDEPAEFSDDGSGTATGNFDLTTLKLNDGTKTLQAYLSLTVDEKTGIASVDVPIAYYAPGVVDPTDFQDAVLTMTYNTETGDVVSETYYAYDSDLQTLSELDADPQGTIAPELLNVTTDGTNNWTPSAARLKADLPSIEYSFDQLPSGTDLYYTLDITDFGGNTAQVHNEVTLP